MEPAHRHFYGVDAMRIGRHRLAASLHLREDHLATSGTVGLTGLGESSLAPGEGQGRGFERAHGRNMAFPNGHLIQRDILRAASASRRTRAAFQRVEAQNRADTPVYAATPDGADTPPEDATHEAATENVADEPMDDASPAAAADAANRRCVPRLFGTTMR